MTKKKRPPVDIDIQWTEDETNPGGNEPSKKLTMELARELGRIAARRQHAEWMAEQERLLAECRELSAACDELLGSAIVPASETPKPDTK